MLCLLIVVDVFMEYQILAEVLMLLLAAVVILYLFRRLRLPPVLGYRVVGIVSGPVGLGIVPTDDRALPAEFGPETKLRAGDVVVLFGTPEALERGESILLNG